MNKGELIDKIAKDAKISKVQASNALNSALDGVLSTLKKGSKVTLVGFGTFSVSSRKARTGRNPQTGAPLKIPAKKVTKFVAGAEFSKRSEEHTSELQSRPHLVCRLLLEKKT